MRSIKCEIADNFELPTIQIHTYFTFLVFHSSFICLEQLKLVLNFVHTYAISSVSQRMKNDP